MSDPNSDTTRSTVHWAEPLGYIAGGGGLFWYAIHTHAKGLLFLGATAFLLVSLAMAIYTIKNPGKRRTGDRQDSSATAAPEPIDETQHAESTDPESDSTQVR